VKVHSPIGVSISNLDKIVHFGIYFVFTLVWFGYFSEVRFGKLFVKNTIKASLLAFFVGVSVEVLQQLITKARTGEVYDVLANCTGILIAVILLCRVKKYKELKTVK